MLNVDTRALHVGQTIIKPQNVHYMRVVRKVLRLCLYLENELLYINKLCANA